MDFQQDHFTLFRLPRRFSIDAAELDQRYREMQAQVHPDRHAHLGDTEKRLAMQWSTRVNEAYQTLKKPLPRAEYLLKLLGVDVHLERAMPTDFLVQQMEWREAVAEAGSAGDESELETLHRRIRKEMKSQYEELEKLLDAGNAVAAAGQTRQLMFQEKLLKEVDEALAGLEV